MPSIDLEITNKVGLHARPAALFVQEANKYQSSILVKKGEKEVSAKSILGILTLGINKGSHIHVSVEGPDADQALEAIKALHANNFGEAE
ncbi:MAG: HPr family phosphocarrier protein [Anaerolineaceae bacterium]